jgi:hypothetical protein
VVGFSHESFDLLHMSSVHDNPLEHVRCLPNMHTFMALHVSLPGLREAIFVSGKS